MLPNFGVGNARMYESDLAMLLLHNARERTAEESLRLGYVHNVLYILLHWANECVARRAAGLELVNVLDLAETYALEFKIATTLWPKQVQ